jgi:hypothetical protein
MLPCVPLMFGHLCAVLCVADDEGEGEEREREREREREWRL